MDSKNTGTKGEIFFVFPNGVSANADDLPRESKNLRTQALIQLAFQTWNWGNADHRHGDTLLADGTFVPPVWGAPVLPLWVSREGEPRHVGTVLLPSRDGEWCGVLEVWKRPSR